jgi:hypothetical protein
LTQGRKIFDYTLEGLKYYATVNMKKIGDEINTKGIYRDIFRDNKKLTG